MNDKFYPNGTQIKIFICNPEDMETKINDFLMEYEGFVIAIQTNDIFTTVIYKAFE